MSSLRFATDHTGFGAESNAEREEREATMAGAWTTDPDVSFFDVDDFVTEQHREWALLDDAARHIRHTFRF